MKWQEKCLHRRPMHGIKNDLSDLCRIFPVFQQKDFSPAVDSDIRLLMFVA